MYKKSGVIFTNTTSQNDIQFNLLVDEYTSHINKYKKIANSIDSINTKWGRDTIKVASMGINDNLKMRQERKSPRHTTCWEEILNVHLQ